MVDLAVVEAEDGVAGGSQACVALCGDVAGNDLTVNAGEGRLTVTPTTASAVLDELAALPGHVSLGPS